MIKGTLVSIHICASAAAPMVSVPQARAVPGRGLEGDRYFTGTGTYSHHEPQPDNEVTLIESEAIEALKRDYKIEIPAGDSRRNLVTRDVPLNHLAGREFQIGAVTLRGLRLCEPCGHLEEVSGRPVRKGLVHRGGLRAQVLTEGMIRVGDSIVLR
jgi:MOSC domain-containing protein YiiM